ncbi:Uncharacterized protein HZ326_29341 [Fusarium oxysporum f. sp. albedinis]|nr:Uncharacterized protein HZ326_29341 [Fusarium oxysporum f. sp. albedinis]
MVPHNPLSPEKASQYDTLIKFNASKWDSGFSVTHEELGRLKSMQLKWHADGLQEEGCNNPVSPVKPSGKAHPPPVSSSPMVCRAYIIVLHCHELLLFTSLRYNLAYYLETNPGIRAGRCRGRDVCDYLELFKNVTPRPLSRIPNGAWVFPTDKG